MFQWLFRRVRVEHTTPQELIELLQATHRRVGNDLRDLTDRLEKLEAAFKSFRGQVYAWRGKLELPTPGAEKAQELPLSDPRVSKEELRARLLQPGKPFKHTN